LPTALVEVFGHRATLRSQWPPARGADRNSDADRSMANEA